MRARLAVLVTALTFTLPSAALADGREESRAQFRRGVELVRQENFKAAKEAFERAYELFPHPSILLNLGTARLKVGDYVQAERDLARFLSDDGGAPADEVEGARRALAETRTHLGTARVRIEPTGARVRIDGQDAAVASGRFTDVRLALGRHRLVASYEGHAPADVSFEVTDPAAPVEVRRTLTPVRREIPLDGGEAGPSPLGLALAGTGVAALGVGAYSGLRARSLASDYNEPGSGHYQDAATRREGVTFRTAADVAFLVGILSVGAGIYLLFVDPPRSSSTARAREIARGSP